MYVAGSGLCAALVERVEHLGAGRLGEQRQLGHGVLGVLDGAVGPDADQHDALEAQLAVLDLGDVLELGATGRRPGAGRAARRGRSRRCSPRGRASSGSRTPTSSVSSEGVVEGDVACRTRSVDGVEGRVWGSYSCAFVISTNVNVRRARGDSRAASMSVNPGSPDAIDVIYAERTRRPPGPRSPPGRSAAPGPASVQVTSSRPPGTSTRYVVPPVRRRRRRGAAATITAQAPVPQDRVSPEPALVHPHRDVPRRRGVRRTRR